MILLCSKGHMSSTKSLKELHSFAKTISLEKEWFVPAGKDVPISFYYVKRRKTRKEAIKAGAKLVDKYAFFIQSLAAQQLGNMNR